MNLKNRIKTARIIKIKYWQAKAIIKLLKPDKKMLVTLR